MKNIMIICAALLLNEASFAQTAEIKAPADKEMSFKSVHGHEVLPQQGEWALGISATGFLNYLGNVANGNTANNAPVFNSGNEANAFAIGQLSGVALMGKYMKRADLAYRVRFMANAGSTDHRNNVLKSMPTPDPLNPIYTEDKVTNNSYTVLLGAGIEKRRGTGRVQGFYGGEVLVGAAGNNRTYAYGNGFDANYTTPMSTTDFSSGSSSYASSRTLASNSGTMVLFGARGFAGVEYFIAPKISLGGELGYTLGFSTNGKNSNVEETWNAPAGKVATITTENYRSNGLRSWGIGMDNVNAGVNLHFYF